MTYTGEIQLFAGKVLPDDWAVCDGTLLDISTYPALFAVIGTTYGGDGVTTFAVPDLRGRVAIGAGQGPGLTSRVLGASGGAAQVALTADQLPAHTHAVNGVEVPPVYPNSGQLAGGLTYIGAGSAGTRVGLAGASVEPTGGGAAHENQQPYVTMVYLICLNGNKPA